jgi:hypothetical protein
VAFTSCDDNIAENSIDEKIALMEQNNSLCFVVSKKYYKINEDNTLIKESIQDRLVSNMTMGDLLNLEYESFHSFYVQGAFFRTEIINHVGGFDENMTSDATILLLTLNMDFWGIFRVFFPHTVVNVKPASGQERKEAWKGEAE